MSTKNMQMIYEKLKQKFESSVIILGKLSNSTICIYNNISEVEYINFAESSFQYRTLHNLTYPFFFILGLHKFVLRDCATTSHFLYVCLKCNLEFCHLVVHVVKLSVFSCAFNAYFFFFFLLQVI